jgi:DNA-directed RNA polymerase specialized sigma24 family protein
MLRPWDSRFERECRSSIDAILDKPGGEAKRQEAWRTLLERIAPRIEDWAARSRVLHHWGLAGPDEARAVLVAVLGRLRADDYDNLRRFRDRRSHSDAGPDEQIDAVTRLARLDEGEPDAAEGAPEADEIEGTAFRAWLLTLIRFAVSDHVRGRLGWASQTGADRRAVASGADRLSSIPEPGGRPPITDWITARQLLAEADRAMAAFPDAMRTALDLWVDDRSYAEISTQLGLADARAAEKLVRAAKARLRDRLREGACG